MLKKIIFTLVALPYLISFQVISILIFLLSFGKINYKFWNNLFFNLQFSNQINLLFFTGFLSINTIISSIIYIHVSKQSFPESSNNLSWSDLNNQIILNPSNNNWNLELYSKNLKVIQKCPSSQAFDLFVTYNGKVITQTFGTKNYEKFIYNVIDSKNNIIIKTTNGKPNIYDFKIFSSMVAYTLKNELIAFILMGSFTKNTFYIRDKNDNKIIKFYFNTTNWEITNLIEQNIFPPSYVSAFLGQHIFATSSKDRCNQIYDAMFPIIIVSTLFSTSILFAFYLLIKNNLKHKTLYQRIN